MKLTPELKKALKLLRVVSVRLNGKPAFKIAKNGAIRTANGCRLCPLEEIGFREGMLVDKGCIKRAGYQHGYIKIANVLDFSEEDIELFVGAADYSASQLREGFKCADADDLKDRIKLRRRLLKACGLTELKEVAAA